MAKLEGYVDEYKGRRACKGCGYVRLVTIQKHLKSENPDEEHYSWYCGVCELISSAEHHERTAAKFRKRAAEMLVRRKLRMKQMEARDKARPK